MSTWRRNQPRASQGGGAIGAPSPLGVPMGERLNFSPAFAHGVGTCGQRPWQLSGEILGADDTGETSVDSRHHVHHRLDESLWKC
jgi:hypothetical protein